MNIQEMITQLKALRQKTGVNVKVVAGDGTSFGTYEVVGTVKDQDDEGNPVILIILK